MKSLESTGTSRCGLINLFPQLLVPSRRGAHRHTRRCFWGARPRPEEGGEVSATHRGFANLGWYVSPGSSAIHHSCHLGASAVGRCQAGRPVRAVLATPTFQMRTLSLRDAGPLAPGARSVWAEPWSSAAALPSFPGLWLLHLSYTEQRNNIYSLQKAVTAGVPQPA